MTLKICVEGMSVTMFPGEMCEGAIFPCSNCILIANKECLPASHVDAWRLPYIDTFLCSEFEEPFSSAAADCRHSC